MTGAEARKLSDEQLSAEVASLKGRLYALRSQTATEKVEDVSQFRKIRADIARLLAEASSRRHAQAPARAAAATPASGKKKNASVKMTAKAGKK